jgi:hypothetical protein
MDIYDEIVKQQVYISYIANGITLTDTEMLTSYDRQLIYQILTEIKEKEQEALKNLKHK